MLVYQRVIVDASMLKRYRNTTKQCVLFTGSKLKMPLEKINYYKSRKGPPASSPGIGKHVLRGQSGFRAGVPRVENKQTELKSHAKIIP